VRRVLSRALEAQARLLGEGEAVLADTRRTLRFLAGRVAFEARPTDVFVATYPRSGTTLTQWMLHLLRHGGEPGPLRHLGDVSPWFERDLALGKLDRRRMDALESPRIWKTHLTADWVPRGARVVAVIRDGRDVAISYYHFYRDYLRFEGSFDEFFERFLSGRVQYGSWFSHTAGWRARAGEGDVLLLHYDALVEDRDAAIRRLAAFLDWPADDDVIDRVVRGSSFEAMKANEAWFDHATALLLERGVTPRSFLRTGKPGEGATVDGEKRAAFEQRTRDARPRRALWLPPFLQ
jgi:hypothetical protein